MMSSKNRNSVITKKDLIKTFWRSFPYEHTWNYERFGHAGFAYAMIPALKKIYPNKKELGEAMTRHMELYQTNHYVVTLPLGIAIAMEEANASEVNFETESISAIKVALMGPLAGVGDAFFWGFLRVLATGVGAALAIDGNILGPIIFFLIFNIPQVLSRWFFIFKGYDLGTNVVETIIESGLMKKITELASIVGMMVVGAMTMDMVILNLNISFGTGDEVTTLQQILDSVIPGIGVLGVFGISYYLLKKEVKPLTIMLFMLIIGVIGAYFGILA